MTDVFSHVLYRGLADGKFADVTREVGLAPPSLSMNSMLMGQLRIGAFADLDGDGWEDADPGQHALPQRGGQAVHLGVTHRSNLRIPPNASGVALADYDRDGRVDVYVTMMGRGKSEIVAERPGGRPLVESPAPQPGRLEVRGRHRVQRRRRRQPLHLRRRLARRRTMTAGPTSTSPTSSATACCWSIKRNGHFTEHPLVDRPADFGTMGVTCGDVDNDGQIDIYAANMYSKAGGRVIGNVRPGTYPDEIMEVMRTYSTGSQLHRNKGGLEFERKGAEWQVADVGWAYGPALVDLDNDGWLDLYATAGYISQDRSKPDG